MTTKKELAKEAAKQRRCEMNHIILVRAKLNEKLRELHKMYGLGERLPKLTVKKEFSGCDSDSFGMCFQDRRLIDINYRQCIEWNMDFVEVLEHEYAHYLTSIYDTEAHGPLWKMTCDRIGHDYSKHGYKE